jgi:hypothetical protein
MAPPSRESFLESRMTRKRSRPVRRGGIGKVPEQSGNSPVSYSTAPPVRGRLLEVNRLFLTLISRFYPITQNEEHGRPGQTRRTPRRARAVLFQVGAGGLQGRP